MARVLIKGGTVVSMDQSVGDFDQGDILIEDDKISEVAHTIDAGDADVIDADGMIVMPGLVNAHIHTWQTGIRGIAGNWTMGDYLRSMHANLATQFKPNDIYLGNLVGALNQINCGVTTQFDWCHNNPTPDHSDGAIDGLEAAGIRALFGHGTPKPDPKPGAPHFSTVPQPASEIERLRKGRFASDDRLVTLGMSVLGPHYGTYDVAVTDFNLAREYDLVVSAHMGIGHARMVEDGIERLNRDGLLDDRFNVVHGNDLSADELKMVADNGGSLTATPEVEIQMGFGYPATGRFIEAGGVPSIGVDVECNISGDMFAVMRLTLQVQRLYDNEPIVQAGKPIEKLSYSARQALEWATINGARTMKMDHKIGSLTPGKQADVTLLRKNDINLFPVNDPLEAIVFQANASNVDTVLIAGKPVKQGGVLLYGDLEAKKTELAQSGERILREAGIVRKAAAE